MNILILKIKNIHDKETYFLKIYNSKNEDIFIRIAEKTYNKLQQLSINEPITANKLGIDK